MAFYKNCDIENDSRTQSYRFSIESKYDRDFKGLAKDIKLRNKNIRQYAREIKEKYGKENAMQYLNRVKLERVKIMARGPRAFWAKRDYRHPRAYDTSLPHEYAVYFDVYVLTDWTNQRRFETEIQDDLTAHQQAAIARSERDKAMFEVEQARLLKEKYGISSYYSKKGIRYESK